MELQTKVNIDSAPFKIYPTDRILFVGSCFAGNIGQRFKDNMFRAVVNPYGVMYNPASILHTVERCAVEGLLGSDGVDIVVFTLGTSHVYILNETGEIVDNCQKRPQALFTEKELTIAECEDYLSEAIGILRRLNPLTKVVLTVSPIRYAKYGFHGSQLSKATLLLAADSVARRSTGLNAYFPAYEIVNDELRDYRFYQPDMLHPSEQAVDYICGRFINTFFSEEALRFKDEWTPIRQALNHRPFNPDSEEYRAFIAKARERAMEFKAKWRIDD